MKTDVIVVGGDRNTPVPHILRSNGYFAYDVNPCGVDIVFKSIMMNIIDWKPFADSLRVVGIGDRVIYMDVLYKNITGNITSTPPDQDDTNWEPIEGNSPGSGEGVYIGDRLGVGREPTQNYVGDFFTSDDSAIVNIEADHGYGSCVRFTNSGAEWDVGIPGASNRFAIESDSNRRIIEMYHCAIHNALFFDCNGTIVNGGHKDCDFTIRKYMSGDAVVYNSGLDILTVYTVLRNEGMQNIQGGLIKKLKKYTTDHDVLENDVLLTGDASSNSVNFNFDNLVPEHGQLWTIFADDITAGLTLSASSGFCGKGLSGDQTYTFQNQYECIEVLWDGSLNSFRLY